MSRIGYRLVLFVTLCFALALGIALGAGPLQQRLAAGAESQFGQDPAADTAADTASDSAAEDALEFADGYAGATSRTVVGDALPGRTVLLVALPGSDPRDVRAVGELVTTAGGTEVGTVSLTPTLLDPARRTFVDELARDLLDTPDGAGPAPGAGSYPMLGEAFAGAFLTRSEDPPLQDAQASGAEATLVEAGLVRVEQQSDRLAQLVVLVAGGPVGDDSEAAIGAELAGAFDAGSLGAVVAGTSAGDGAAVAAVRESAVGEAVSTVDGVDLAAARVATVLALGEQSQGGVGHYGLSGSDGAVPQR